MAEGPQTGTPAGGPTLISLDQAAALLGLSTMRVRQLARDGALPAIVKGRVPLVGAVQGYIAFLKDEGRRTSKSAADSRVRDARAREIELRLAKDEGELIPVAEAVAVIDQYATAVVTALKSMPARYSRKAEERARLQPLVDEALATVAKKMAAAADEVAGARPGTTAATRSAHGPLPLHPAQAARR